MTSPLRIGALDRLEQQRILRTGEAHVDDAGVVGCRPVEALDQRQRRRFRLAAAAGGEGAHRQHPRVGRHAAGSAGAPRRCRRSPCRAPRPSAGPSPTASKRVGDRASELGMTLSRPVSITATRTLRPSATRCASPSRSFATAYCGSGDRRRSSPRPCVGSNTKFGCTARMRWSVRPAWIELTDHLRRASGCRECAGARSSSRAAASGTAPRRRA